MEKKSITRRGVCSYVAITVELILIVAYKQVVLSRKDGDEATGSDPGLEDHHFPLPAENPAGPRILKPLLSRVLAPYITQGVKVVLLQATHCSSGIALWSLWGCDKAQADQKNGSRYSRQVLISFTSHSKHEKYWLQVK